MESSHAGQPTKYNPKMDRQAYKLSLLGYTDAQLADFFEVNESTLNLYKTQYPKFLESIKRGKEAADMYVVDSLYKNAQDRTVLTEEAIKVRDADGNERIEIVKVKKGQPADFRAQRFWLMNRQKETWRDKQETEVSGNLTIQTITGMEVK